MKNYLIHALKNEAIRRELDDILQIYSDDKTCSVFTQVAKVAE